MRWDSDFLCSWLWTLHVSWERAAQGQHNRANRPLQIKFLKVNVPSEFLQVVLADTCRLGTRWEQLRWKLFGHHHVRKPSKNKILKHLCVALIDSSESDESNLKKCSGSSFACRCSFFSLSWFFPKASSGWPVCLVCCSGKRTALVEFFRELTSQQPATMVWNQVGVEGRKAGEVDRERSMSHLLFAGVLNFRLLSRAL